ncbi:MAG: hypothetical protein WA741_10205 [Candidatus Sulfotelmatobacter sp.]
MRRLLLITLLAALAPCASAQRMGAASPHFAARFNRGAFPRPSFFPLAYSDPFYADYLSNTGYPIASQPPVIILQSPQVRAPEPERFAPPAQPLMIELQGDRYVRVTGPETSGAEMIDRMPEGSRLSEHSSAPIHAPTPAELPPAVLIFRDGHREETSDYTIADGILYARTDYYTTGSWNRKIELSSLNLPETAKSNESRGVKFQIPSSPNQVIVRP